MDTKPCTRCKQVKSLDQFTRRKDRPSGYVSRCKQCAVTETVRSWQKNKVKYRTPESRKKNTERMAAWRKQNVEKVKIINFKSYHNAKEKFHTRYLLNSAVRAGKILKLSCQYPQCGNIKTEAHHFDYAKPLDVKWFCKKHHALSDKITYYIYRKNNH